MRLTLRVNLMCRPVTRPYDGLMSKPRVHPLSQRKVTSAICGARRKPSIQPLESSP